MKMMHSISNWAAKVILLAAALLLVGKSNAQDYYTVTFIGQLPGQLGTAGLAVNNLGHVCGYSGTKAFFWSSENGLVELPPLPPRTTAIARDLNDSDLVVGSSGIDFLGPQANRTVRWRNGVIENLGTLPGGSRSEGYGINDSGWVAGYGHYYLNGNEYWRPTWYRDGFGMDTLAGVTGGYAYDINNLGQVVGYSSPGAFIWTLSTGADYLPGPTGWVSSLASGISNDGVWVVGTLINSSGSLRRFARWSQTTGWQMYGLLNNSGLTAVNRAGECVGGSSSISTGYIYTDALGLRDINQFIDPVSGWVINSTTDINENGQITGSGQNTITFQAGAILLTPPPSVPLPIDDLTIIAAAGSVVMSWSAIADASQYLVHGAMTATFVPGPENLLSTTTATTITLPADATVKFYVVIVQSADTD